MPHAAQGIEPNFPNRTLALMDNLRFLLALDDACIDLIAIDPPFGKMETFRSQPKPLITPAEKGEEIGLFLKHHPEKNAADFKEDGTYSKVDDLWEWNKDIEKETSHARFMRELEVAAKAAAEGNDAEEGSLANRLYHIIHATMAASGHGMAAYIAFMAQRLVECHRVLKDTGSIYVHCDWKANSHLRMLMDAIFGSGNFRNEIVWGYAPQGRYPKYGFHRKHDTLLYYSRNEEPVFNPQYGEMNPNTRKAYSKRDSDGRYYLEVKNKSGKKYRSYLDQNKGRPVSDWWVDIQSQGTTYSSKEWSGYSTQKPLALYERIITASSNPGDVVLDVFAGCATTAVAAERLGRHWLACDHAYRAWTMIKRRFYQNGYRLDGTTEATAAAYGEHQTGWADDLEIKRSQVVGPDEVTPREQLLPDLEVVRGGARRATVWNGNISKDECKEMLLARFGCVCWGCNWEPKLPNGEPDPAMLEVEHLFAKKPDDGEEGGDDNLYNLGLACRKCNGVKGNRLTMTQLRDDRALKGLVWNPGQDKRPHLERARMWATQEWGERLRQEALA